MPRIRLSMSETLEILKWNENIEEFAQIWMHINEKGFIFNEFTLIVEKERIYKVKIQGYGKEQKIIIKVIWRDFQDIAHNKTIETKVEKFLEEIIQVIHENSIKEINEWDVNKDCVDIMPVMFFMQYAVEKAMHREYKEMPITNKKYKPIEERKKNKPKQEYKLFEVIRKYEKHINHNKHNITCERWDVKGHFRHYKNGKITYVKPYEKGKGIKKEKEYKL